jgi:hemerythrin-like domain-containing protein
MQGQEILRHIMDDHNRLRSELREWEAALEQSSGSSYGQCQHALAVLQELCRALAYECQHHFREEETVLYTVVEFTLPHLRGLVGELRGEHDSFRQALEQLRRELARFNATGEQGSLPVLGRDLVRLLRGHLEREERELHPVVQRDFREGDWHELSRVHFDTQVA